jgi:hypothetical protein
MHRRFHRPALIDPRYAPSSSFDSIPSYDNKEEPVPLFSLSQNRYRLADDPIWMHRRFHRPALTDPRYAPSSSFDSIPSYDNKEEPVPLFSLSQNRYRLADDPIWDIAAASIKMKAGILAGCYKPVTLPLEAATLFAVNFVTEYSRTNDAGRAIIDAAKVATGEFAFSRIIPLPLGLILSVGGSAASYFKHRHFNADTYKFEEYIFSQELLDICGGKEGMEFVLFGDSHEGRREMYSAAEGWAFLNEVSLKLTHEAINLISLATDELFDSPLSWSLGPDFAMVNKLLQSAGLYQGQQERCLISAGELATELNYISSYFVEKLFDELISFSSHGFQDPNLAMLDRLLQLGVGSARDIDNVFSNFKNRLPSGPLVTSALPAILFQQRMRLFPESTLQGLTAVHRQAFGSAFDLAEFQTQLTRTLTGPSIAINPLAFVPESIKPKSVFETNPFMRSLKELTSRIYLDDSDRIEIQINSDGSTELKIGTKAISATWSRLHGFQQKRENIDAAESRFQRAEAEYTDAITAAISKFNAEDPTAMDAINQAAQKQGQRKQSLQQLKHALGELNDETRFFGIKIHEHGKETRERTIQGIRQCNVHKEAVAADDALLLSLEAAAHIQNGDLSTANTRVQKVLRGNRTHPMANQLEKHIQSQQLTEQAIAELTEGHFANANEQAQKAILLNPDNTSAHNLISIAQSYELAEEALLLLATDRMAAFERAEEALERYSSNPPAETIIRTTWTLFYTDLVSHLLGLLLPRVGPKFFSASTTKTLLESTHITGELVRTTTRLQELVELSGIQATPKAWMQQLGTPGALSITNSVLNIAALYTENPRLRQVAGISRLTSRFFNSGGNGSLLHSSLAILDGITFGIDFVANTLGQYLPNPVRNVLYEADIGLRLLYQLQSQEPMETLVAIHGISECLYQSYPLLFQRQAAALLPKAAKTALKKLASAPVLNLFIPHTNLILTLTYSITLMKPLYKLNIKAKAQRQRFELHSACLNAVSIVTDTVSRQFLPHTKTPSQFISLISTIMQPTLMDAIRTREGFFAIRGMFAEQNGDTPYSIPAIKDTLFGYRGWQSVSLWTNIFRSSLPLASSIGLIDPSSRIHEVQPYLEYASMGISFYDTVSTVLSLPKLSPIERKAFLHSPGSVGLLRTSATFVSMGFNYYERKFSNDNDSLPENPVYLLAKATSGALSENTLLGFYHAASYVTAAIPSPVTVLAAANVAWDTRNRYLFARDFNQLFNLIKEKDYRQAVSKVAALQEFNITWNWWAKSYKGSIDHADFFLRLVDENNPDADKVHRDIFAYLKSETLEIAQECQFASLANDAFIQGIHELARIGNFKEAETRLRHYESPPGLQPACVSPNFGAGWELLDKQVRLHITRRNMFFVDMGCKALRIGLKHRSLPLFLPDTVELARELFVNHLHHGHDRGFIYRVTNTFFTIVDHLLPFSEKKGHFVIRTLQTALEAIFLYQSCDQIYKIATSSQNSGINDATFSLQTYFVFMHLMAITGYFVAFLRPTNYFKNLFEQTHRYLQNNRIYRCFSSALAPYTIYRVYPDLPLLLNAGPYFAQLNERLPWLERAFISTRNSFYQAESFMMRGKTPWLAATVGMIFCCRSIRKAARIEQALLERCETISQLTREGKYDDAYPLIQEVNEANFQIQSNRRYFIALKAFALLYKTNPEPLVARKVIYPVLRQYQDSEHDEIYYTLLKLATLTIFKLQYSDDPNMRRRLRYLAYQAKKHCELLVAHEPNDSEYVTWKKFASEMIKLNNEERALPNNENNHRWAPAGFFERQSNLNGAVPPIEIVEEGGASRPESITHSYPFSMQHRS